jgi:hypothetical protein
MLIIGIFEQSIEMEQALAEIENSSIPKEHILVTFMDNDPKKNNFREHSPHAFEIGISIATGCAVIGASSGFVLKWGPIIWGLIGALIGFTIGVIAYYFIKKARTKKKSTNREVTILIQCTKEQSPQIRNILWNYQALSVGQVD